MNVERYLARTGFAGDATPTLEVLRAMHRAHFARVPFENLSIARGEPIILEPERIFDKLVNRSRGGFCLEVASLFGWALREIGFRVELVGGRPMEPSGALMTPLTHMAIVVHLEEPWLADVGFGGRVVEPLRLRDPLAQVVGRRSSVVANDGDHWLITYSDPWVTPIQPRGHLLTLQPRQLEEFEPVCHWLQTSPDSQFTTGDVATLGLEDGRKTYSRGRLIVTRGDTREEFEVPPAAVTATLSAEFGLTV